MESTGVDDDRQPNLHDNTIAKPRLKWTGPLHERFVDAVMRLGGAEKATPKSVMRIMGVPGLTLYHLKSHLQKYRLAKSRVGAVRRDFDDGIEGKMNFYGHMEFSLTRTGDADCGEQVRNTDPEDARIATPSNNTADINGSMLQMQMQVQKQLLEQLEVQKHLQLRIEAQGKYLQLVLKKAEETLAAYNLSSTAAAHGGDDSRPSFPIRGSSNEHYHSDSCVTTTTTSWKMNRESTENDRSEETSLPSGGEQAVPQAAACIPQQPQTAAQSRRVAAQEHSDVLFDLNR